MMPAPGASMRIANLSDLLGDIGPPPVYANQVKILANQTEVRLIFGVVHPAHPRILVSSIIMTPIVVKALVEMLSKNIQKWEEQYGHITLPEEADRLIAGLFGMGGPDDGHQHSGESPEDQESPDQDS